MPLIVEEGAIKGLLGRVEGRVDGVKADADGAAVLVCLGSRENEQV